MTVFAKERVKTVVLMPQGNTVEEAFEIASYQAERGDYSEVEIDTTYRTTEVIEPTLYGRICNFVGNIASKAHLGRSE